MVNWRVEKRLEYIEKRAPELYKKIRLFVVTDDLVLKGLKELPRSEFDTLVDFYKQEKSGDPSLDFLSEYSTDTPEENFIKRIRHNAEYGWIEL